MYGSMVYWKPKVYIRDELCFAPTWAVIHEISLFYVQRAQMDVAKFLNAAILSHYGGFLVATECVVAVMHDWFEIIGYISTVNAIFVVFVESKPVVYEKGGKLGIMLVTTTNFIYIR